MNDIATASGTNSRQGSSSDPLESVWVRIVAAIQTTGGLMGVFIAISMMGLEGVPPSSEKTILIPSSFAAIFGVILWRNRRGGLETSAIMQFVQCVSIMQPFIYKVHFGFALDVLVTEGGFRLAPELGTTVFHGPADMTSPNIFALNITAIVSFVYLLFLWKKTGGTFTREPAPPKSKAWWVKDEFDDL